MIFIVVKFKPKPEYVETFPDRVADFTRDTRSEPGNMWFDWSRSLEDPSEYVLVEASATGTRERNTSPASTSRGSSPTLRNCWRRRLRSSARPSTRPAGRTWAR